MKLFEMFENFTESFFHHHWDMVMKHQAHSLECLLLLQRIFFEKSQLGKYRADLCVLIENAKPI